MEKLAQHTPCSKLEATSRRLWRKLRGRARAKSRRKLSLASCDSPCRRQLDACEERKASNDRRVRSTTCARRKGQGKLAQALGMGRGPSAAWRRDVQRRQRGTSGASTCATLAVEVPARKKSGECVS